MPFYSYRILSDLRLRKEKIHGRFKGGKVATINYTSGTTGFPKGVMYHHRGAYLNTIGEVLECGFTYSSMYLWTLPIFHRNGF
jgi:long-subunit acyl-CoA synthetase (AMP-forming)